MPSSSALAKLHGDGGTAQALHALRCAIYQAGAVRDTSITLEAVWSSLGKEAQDGIRMGFDDSRWEIVAPFPLTHNARSRVGRLRAYGNAINAVQAQIFIESLM